MIIKSGDSSTSLFLSKFVIPSFNLPGRGSRKLLEGIFKLTWHCIDLFLVFLERQCQSKVLSLPPFPLGWQLNSRGFFQCSEIIRENSHLRLSYELNWCPLIHNFPHLSLAVDTSNSQNLAYPQTCFLSQLPPASALTVHIISLWLYPLLSC